MSAEQKPREIALNDGRIVEMIEHSAYKQLEEQLAVAMHNLRDTRAEVERLTDRAYTAESLLRECAELFSLASEEFEDEQVLVARIKRLLRDK